MESEDFYLSVSLLCSLPEHHNLLSAVYPSPLLHYFGEAVSYLGKIFRLPDFLCHAIPTLSGSSFSVSLLSSIV